GVEQFTRALAAALGVGEPAGWTGAAGAGVDAEWLAAAVEDLQRSRARSVVVLGDHYPPDLHAVVHRINAELGNLGATVQLFEAPGGVGLGESGLGTLAELVQAAAASEVDCLLVLDSNPVYDAPADLDVAGALAKVPHSIHFGLYDDETGVRCRWQIPAAHDLESWSDARWLDGTASLVQPLIAPLYGGKTVHEVLSALMEPLPRPSFEIVRQTWQAELGDDFERGWHDALSQGIVAGTAATPQTPEPVAAGAPAGQGAARPDAAEGLEIVLVPDPSVGDGRMANNGWLQELPKPMTTLTWDNAVLIAPADATRAGLANGDVVRIAWDGREASGPVFVVPGHAIGSVTCHLGYGRTRAGRVGSGVGFNAYRLLAADGRFLGRGVELTKTGGRMELARTQKHHAIDGRNIVHSALLETYRREPESVLPAALHHELPSLYPEEQYDRFAWGMAIDLSKCQGCNACVVACQAENNVPVVGKERVLEGREMHWLRMDAYFSGAADNPEVIHQPMLCQHCEKAPCEVVCPVAATTHSDDGLNEMTYNRCIGTRYCSNNCPYKVRRFNFYDYTGDSLPVVELGRNPDVTVRSRGVMEKCTYCVQRLNRARMDAKKEQVDVGGRLAIEDGVLQTACQQACPTRAIVFGDLNDPNSQVSRMKK
ncbi:MAG TPA: 4Fe-4S dicluster domain-containing protein, partial [Lacipirellulaceae bacterium]|nr:4Fe-4S dicluster domain-containing protein [Lacipirellulaceae bacterium]